MPKHSDRTSVLIAGRSLGQRFGPYLAVFWILLLLLPAVTAFASLNDWDVDQRFLFLATAWVLGSAFLLLPPTLFYALTWPLAWVGVACAIAHVSRQIDLLELAAQWRFYSAGEVRTALGPYAMSMVAAAILLAILAWACWRFAPRRSFGVRSGLACACVGLALAAAAPGAVWTRAWPLNALTLLASAALAPELISADWFPNSSTRNPRGEGRSWGAKRSMPVPDLETYVLVIGESLRSDYLRECQGSRQVQTLNAEAVVACDVTAGSDATHTAVPLLVSRERPGSRFRVPRDSSFVRAFAEVGFETYWISLHGPTLVWSEASHQSYLNPTELDRQLLLPLLKATLSNAIPRRLIVLHAYNAHAPYCGRFERGSAPNPVDCAGLDMLPTPSTVERWRTAYANAVDESVRFLNAVIDELARSEGQVFLIYTPDHAENLLDDSRALYQHALRHPTRWDIQVPAIFWANSTWRRAHPEQWSMLKSNATAPLMHADLVPTLLGAAGIAYEEPRREVVNLLAQPVPVRKRLVQKSLGAVTDWPTLLGEAEH
jgi:glucan phosphoethanolaminetransferase (alkaline phosphatase superfamily)